MKRNISLVPLSQDHYDGLLLAVRLQQGSRALERLWSHDPVWQANYVVEFYEQHLTPHFEAEEAVVFPLAKIHLNDTSIIDRLVQEHETMREYVQYFRAPDQNTLQDKLVQFGTLLESHIRCEEREFFPLCESSVPEAELEKIKEPLLHYKPLQKGHS